MTRPFAFVCAVALLGTEAACFDLSPLPYDAPEGGADAGLTDALEDIDALVGECSTCLTQGACKAQLDPCMANPKCVLAETCLTQSYCWASPLTNATALAPCILTCSIQAGVAGTSDPVAQLITPVFVCAQDPAQCGSVCAPGLMGNDP